MARKYIIIFLFFLISVNAYPEAGISFGVLGVGGSITNKSYNSYYFGRIPYLYYEMETGFGIAFSPLMYFMRINDTSDYYLTFANISLYYNFFKDWEGLVLGPVVSAHAINNSKRDFFEMRFGLQSSVRIIEPIKNQEFVVLELGYKHNEQQQGFYAYAGVNLLLVLIFIGNSKANT